MKLMVKLRKSSLSARYWKCDIRGIRNYTDLPENCRAYVEFIEDEIGFPVKIVTNGPKREDVILR